MYKFHPISSTSLLILNCFRKYLVKVNKQTRGTETHILLNDIIFCKLSLPIYQTLNIQLI